jgi:hypothetical protein
VVVDYIHSHKTSPLIVRAARVAIIKAAYSTRTHAGCESSNADPVTPKRDDPAAMLDAGFRP